MNVNVEPRPSLLATEMRPPWPSMMCRAIDSPSPVPPWPRCGGNSVSGPVNDRAVYHLDNAYFLENIDIVSHRCKTHTVSNTAFRGFGGPQGMMVIERVIDDIARNLQSTTSRVDQLVHDPALSDSIQRVNRSLADIEKITATTKDNIGPVIQSLRNAAAAAEGAAGRANQLLATAPQQNYDLGALIKELTRAAESIRALADYLTENPDALLKGRR